MKDLKKSIVESLDGADIAILPYIPYIFQDLFELGSDPVVMVSLIKKNIRGKNLKILDLGCGKGAVSISIAKELGCQVRGIDAMPQFVESAKRHAARMEVDKFCEFSVGDIRIELNNLKGFDVIILGAVGMIFENLKNFLIYSKRALKSTGYVILDDAYMEDDSRISYDRCLKKSSFFGQIASAGFCIVQEVTTYKISMLNENSFMLTAIKVRINELIELFPLCKELFLDYLRSQEYETGILSSDLVCATWLLKREEKDDP